ncbi:MAG: Hsp20/alpha crystallin family protein [bacterium]|nr:Hsp20/alpha crystallin family protein [bacterium]
MKSGQALVMLLVFVAISLIITTAAVVMMTIGSISAARYATSQQAAALAESGAENALVRLLRDPNYSGETLTINDSPATITITGTDPKTITSTGVAGEFTRTIQIVAGFTDGILTINSWQEIF